MAIKSADQISIIDVTDAYSVIMTSESHTFVGGVNGATEGSCSTQIMAMRGAEFVNCLVNEITAPDGIEVSTDNTNEYAGVLSPIITFTITGIIASGGVITIPVHISDGGVMFNKTFSYAIAFSGNGIEATITTYAVSNSGTTVPTSGWTSSVPAAGPGEYIWTKTVTSYTDGSAADTTTYSVSMMGQTGATGNGIKSTLAEYVASFSGTTTPTTGWATTIPAVDPTEYLWTRVTTTYTNGDKSYSYTVGAPGADAITITITSSNGTIFKNNSIETTLTAHVYRSGTELTDTEVSKLGTIKWYKDGNTTAVSTGKTLVISANTVHNKATYIAQLEG